MSEKKQDELKGALSSLANAFSMNNASKAESSANEELKNLYNKIVNSSDPIEDYFYEVLHEDGNIKDGLLQLSGVTNSKARWLMLHSSFVECQFKKFIERVEGSPCCADKSRTIIRALFFWLHQEKKIVFNYEQEYTFHLPKQIFNTHEKIADFFEAIMALYYGMPEKYLAQLKEILAG